MALRTNAIDEARTCFEELRNSGPKTFQVSWAGALIQLGHMAVDADRLREAEPLYGEALTICRGHALPWNETIPLLGLANIELRQYQFSTARKLTDEALKLATELEDRMLLTDVEQRLGMTDLMEGKPAAARQHFTRALQLSLDFGNLEGRIESLEFIARHAHASGQWIRTLRLLGAASAHREALGFGPFSSFIESAAAQAHQSAGPDADAAWMDDRKLSLAAAVAEAMIA